MDERMQSLWTVKKFACWKFETENPSTSQLTTVCRMCKNGTLPAAKIGKEWRIDVANIMEEFNGK